MTEETNEPTQHEMIKTIFGAIQEGDKKKIKALKLGKAKVSKSKIKKGWSGIIFMNPNKNITGERVKLEGGTYQTKDKHYHVTNGSEQYMWEGKFPVYLQRHDRLNPSKDLEDFVKVPEKNEVYGDDMVFKRMKSDLIKPKGSMGKMIWIIGAIIAVYFIYTKFFGGS